MMKLSKVIAGVAATGGLFAMNAAHAFVPAVAAGLAALAGAAVGSAASHPQPPAVAVVQPPAVAVAPDNTVVMGGPPATVTEVIPAPRDGYQWQRGHYELRDGVSAWVPGHWVANDVVIYEH